SRWGRRQPARRCRRQLCVISAPQRPALRSIDEMPAASQAARVYDLHGTRVRSEIALGPGRIRAPRWDLELAWGGARAIPPEPPPGEVLAHRTFVEGRGYSLARDGSGVTVRFDGLCDFRVDRGGRRARAYPSPAIDRRL